MIELLILSHSLYFSKVHFQNFALTYHSVKNNKISLVTSPNSIKIFLTLHKSILNRHTKKKNFSSNCLEDKFLSSQLPLKYINQSH